MPAVSLEYRRFLEAFLPALQTKLEEFGFDREHVYFHISDEPSKENLESYMQAKAAVEEKRTRAVIVTSNTIMLFLKYNPKLEVSTARI